jgi:hypothetical protein
MCDRGNLVAVVLRWPSFRAGYRERYRTSYGMCDRGNLVAVVLRWPGFKAGYRERYRTSCGMCGRGNLPAIVLARRQGTGCRMYSLRYFQGILTTVVITRWPSFEGGYREQYETSGRMYRRGN